MDITIGSTASAALTVGPDDLASVLAQSVPDAFPPVFATARMVGLMELAASRVLHPLLSAGQMSVGVSIDVSHAAATPLGARVLAEARLTGLEGKLYLFEVVAHDAGGEIGRGTHRRAIVSAERIVLGAANRCPVVE